MNTGRDRNRWSRALRRVLFHRFRSRSSGRIISCFVGRHHFPQCIIKLVVWTCMRLKKWVHQGTKTSSGRSPLRKDVRAVESPNEIRSTLANVAVERLWEPWRIESTSYAADLFGLLMLSASASIPCRGTLNNLQRWERKGIYAPIIHHLTILKAYCPCGKWVFSVKISESEGLV